VPFGAVREDPDVTLVQLVRAAADVTRQLVDSVGSDATDAQVALDLDDGEADFDVDAATLPSGRLEDDVVEVLLAQV